VADLYVLNTHVLIWYFIGSKRLRSALKDKIDETRNRNGRLLVPTIVLVEALDVAEKRKVQFDFSQMYLLVRQEPDFEIVGLTSEILDQVQGSRCNVRSPMFKVRRPIRDIQARNE